MDVTKELKELSTSEKIDVICTNLAFFLKCKNEKYGDSALTPIKVFNKQEIKDSILTRLDDKLSRIANSNSLRKNDIVDLTGYLVLLCIEQQWLSFSELID